MKEGKTCVTGEGAVLWVDVIAACNRCVCGGGGEVVEEVAQWVW